MLFLLTHIIHVITVILWIGALSFITYLILPLAIKTPDALQKVLLFQRIEHRFAKIARVFNIVTGVSGFIMTFMMGWQSTLFTRAGIPLTAMTVIWVFWFVMLFGLEPLVIKKMLEGMAKSGDKSSIDAIFLRLNRMHWLMVVASFVAVTAGVFVAHGVTF